MEGEVVVGAWGERGRGSSGGMGGEVVVGSMRGRDSSGGMGGEVVVGAWRER